MKIFALIIGLMIFSSCGFTTANKNKLASFNLLLVDSTTTLNTENIPDGNPFVLIYFSPDCDHCQKETEDIIKNMKALEHVNLYYITNDSIERLRVFRDYYKTGKYPNIVLCWDYQYAFIKNYKPNTTPYSLVFNRDKDLVAVFAGQSNATDLIKTIKKL